MDPVDLALAEFQTRRDSSAPSKIDALLEVEHLSDARVVPLLIQVARDSDELPDVRVHVVRVLRNRHPETGERSSVAHAIGHVLSDGSTLALRAQAALAMAEFTDVEGVIRMLGTVALDVTEPLDLRYSAFTSLERAGPQPECIVTLRQLAADETLGRSARRLLSTWNES
jgi:hypothetical protein